MADAGEVKLSMRVWIDKEKKKVIFAEVDSHFADILVSFFTLPLGTIVRILNKHYGDEAPVIGSLNNLYNSLENLDEINFWSKYCKSKLLNSKNTFGAHLQKLKINVDNNTEPIKYFVCENLDCLKRRSVSVSMRYGTVKCRCGSLLQKELSFDSGFTDRFDCGVFTRETASFILTDDLQLMPNLVQSGLQILNNVGINGTSDVEEKIVFVGFQEVMDLLKGSLISKTPLTDLIFRKTPMIPLAVKSEFSSLVNDKATTATSVKVSVNVFVRKSTGKILLAQTTGGFAHFLFSFLVISLGGVFSLLDGDFFLGSIHNLYQSLTSLYNDTYLMIHNPFGKPCVPYKHLSMYQILPVTEQPGPAYCCYDTNGKFRLFAKQPSRTSPYNTICSVAFMDPDGLGSHVKGQAMFIITNDLDVKPTYASSGLSILHSLKVLVNDIEERIIEIGMKEALSILKASLSSKSALNDGLGHLLGMQPKEEK